MTNFERNISKLEEEFKESNTIILNEINRNYTEKNFREYGLLNKDWIDNFKSLDKDNILQNFDLKLYKREIMIDQKGVLFCFPSNFYLVTRKFIDFLFDNFIKSNYDKSNFCYNVQIGANCTIIKDKTNKYLVFISLDSKDGAKNIDYIIQFLDTEFMEDELKNILESNFSKYLKEIKIIDRKLYRGKVCVGYISKINKNENGIISSQDDIKGILCCLSQFNEFKNEIISQAYDNQNIFFNSVINFFKYNQNQCINEIQSSILSKYIYTDYKNTIFIFLNELNKNLSQISNKNYICFNLSNPNEERQKLNEFIISNTKGSIIDYSIYYIEEIMYYCSVQNKCEYTFEIHPFISVKLDGLSQKYKYSDLLKPKKNKKCKFCGIKNDNCFIENKIVTLPKILIIVLDGIHEQNFQIKYIIDHEQVLYNLKCFIDDNKNIYFKKEGFWYSICDEEKNIEKKIDNIDGLYPRILFYNFVKANNIIINNINEYKINNIRNQNNMNYNRNLFNMNNNNNFMNNNFNNMNFNNLNNNQNFNNMNNNNDIINNQNNININNKNGNQNNNINYMVINENNMNNINNKNSKNTDANIFVTFTFVKYNKKIFLDISENMLFKDVIFQLEEKYSWLKCIKNKFYYFENTKIDINRTVRDLKIKDNSDIIIQI